VSGDNAKHSTSDADDTADADDRGNWHAALGGCG
jgi:hypothetical protein